MMDRMYNALMSVERKTAAAERDRHNQVVYTWGTIATGRPCRIEGQAPPSNVESTPTLGSAQVVTGGHTVFCGTGEDVTEKDRVVIGGRRFEVKFVNREPGGVTGHHFEIACVEVRT